MINKHTGKYTYVYIYIDRYYMLSSNTGKTFKDKIEEHKKLVEYHNKTDTLIRLNGNMVIQAKAIAKAKAKVKSK